MPVDSAHQYLQNIDIILAQDRLMQLQIMDYPHLKAGARTKIFRQIRRAAFPTEIRGEERALTTQDLAKMFGGG